MLEFRYATSARFEQALTAHVRSVQPHASVDFNYHGNPPFSWEVGQRPVQHAGNSDFVRPGDEPRAEPAVEAKKPFPRCPAGFALRLRPLVRLQLRELLRQAPRVLCPRKSLALRRPRALLLRPALRPWSWPRESALREPRPPKRWSLNRLWLSRQTRQGCPLGRRRRAGPRRSQGIRTAAETTVVQMPSLCPSADWVML